MYNKRSSPAHIFLSAFACSRLSLLDLVGATSVPYNLLVPSPIAFSPKTPSSILPDNIPAWLTLKQPEKQKKMAKHPVLSVSPNF